MKKLISFFLSLVMLLSMLPTAYAEDSLTENICIGKNASALNDDLTIEGRSTRTTDVAIDGSLDTFWMAYLSTATIREYPWYIVDLGSEYSIAEIRLQARRDSNKANDRKNFKVQLSNDPTFADYFLAGEQGVYSYAFKETWSCTVAAQQKYRYVRIIKTALENLSISELQIYANTQPAPEIKDPIVRGNPFVGESLSVDYLYYHEDGIPEGETRFAWYLADKLETMENAVLVQESTENNYILKQSDAGKYIVCVVTPICQSVEQAEGFSTPVYYDRIIRVSPTEPVGYISSPQEGGIYSLADSIKLSAFAESGTVQVASVEYYIDNKSVGKSTAEPFDLTVTDVPMGEHSVYAVITNVNDEDAITESVGFMVSENEITYKKIGAVHQKRSNEADNDWFSIGCEGLDRDMADYNSYKSYLHDLGATKARIQAGWAKCEKVKGEYDWDWLDEIIYDMSEHGIRPWVNTCYGNSIYEGGGGTSLSGGIPTSEEALAAWDNWVAALATRYHNVVKEWEIWNEADHGSCTMSEYTVFFVRTAEIIRSIDPDAKIIGLASANTQSSTVKSFLSKLETMNKLNLLDIVTIHGYPSNPDTNTFTTLQGVVKSYSTNDHTISLWCGETGAPHMKGGSGALGNMTTSELIQSKWMARRVLSARAKNTPISYFLIVDLMYEQNSDGTYKRNYKGLLKVNSDKTVAGTKQSYGAYRNIVSVFDNSLSMIPNYEVSTEGAESGIHITAYEKSETGKQVIASWFNAASPNNATNTTPVTFTVNNGDFEHPVYIDLVTGNVYEIRNWEQTGTSYTFKYIPIYDSPILIADASAVEIDYDSDTVISKPEISVNNINNESVIQATSSIVTTGNVKSVLNMIIAAYDSNNRLISVSLSDDIDSSEKQEGEEISVQTKLSSDAADSIKIIKAFVWDMKSLKAFSDSAEYEITKVN